MDDDDDETCIMNKTEMKKTQTIMDNIINNILKTPKSTPSELITAETGIWDIETQTMNKQVIYLHKILTKTNSPNLTKIITNPNNPWFKQIEKMLKTIKITKEQLEASTDLEAKRLTKEHLNEYQNNKISKLAETK
jgi:hypothetical protein